MTSDWMSSLPGAFPQARDLIALRSSSTEGETLHSFREACTLNCCVRNDVPSTVELLVLFCQSLN